MPKKVLYFIIFLLVAVIFFISNNNNLCNISVVFYTFENVHVVYSLAISFLLGMLVVLPFAIFKGKKKVGKTAKKSNSENSPEEDAP
jgi:choline-glycine betaine transporter